jgi:hypothetical protein
VNGNGIQFEITRSAAGYTIKLQVLAANDPAETMVDVGFNPATGEIKFTRPLKFERLPGSDVCRQARRGQALGNVRLGARDDRLFLVCGPNEIADLYQEQENIFPGEARSHR